MAPSEGPSPRNPLFVCPAEKHISVSFQEIFNLFRSNMNVAQKQKYEEVCQLIESLYAQDFMTLRRSVKHHFLPFSAGAKSQQLVTRKGRPLPPKIDLDMREQKLVEDFLQLMASARFNLMTKEEWDIATAEKFMFYLPVEVNWEYFDNTVLPRFWNSSPERQALREALPDLADRVLLLHRGIGLAQHSSLFINEKIDLLLEYVLINTLSKLWAWLLAVLAQLRSMLLRRGGKQVAHAPSIRHAAPAGIDAPILSPIPLGSTNNGLVGRGASWTGSWEPEAPHRATRVVERRTLARLLPTAWSVIVNMFKPLQLQEPMYKEVVVMYRTSGAGRAQKKKKNGNGSVRSRSTEERLKDILARRNIHIRCFHDIPLADMEVIFPDKKVYIKPLRLINLLVQAITTFTAAIASLWKMGALDMKTVMSALSAVAARCGSLYSSMQAERSNMIQEMVNILYDKTNDAQEGVLSMLLEDMAEQQVKEAAVAYTILYNNIDNELTEAEVDDLCERWLEEQFGVSVDFKVEDALPKLLSWGMIKYNASSRRYQALPLQQAHASLSVHWAKAYEALSRPPQTRELPLSLLLPTGHPALPGFERASDEANLFSPPSEQSLPELSGDSRVSRKGSLFKRAVAHLRSGS